MRKKNILDPGSWVFFWRFNKKKARNRLVVCAFLIFLLNLDEFRIIPDSVRGLFTSINVAACKIFENVSDRIYGIWYYIFHDVNRVIYDLRIENVRIKNEIENLNHLKRENEKLRKLLSIKETPICDIIAAKIVTIFSNDYVRSCVLNVGSRDGVVIDAVLRNDDGLIGRISEVHEKWSRALFITDTNSNIPVKIGNEHVNAIVSGDNSDVLHISMKHDDIAIKDGDIVETSGFGNVFRDKIPVGKVVEKNGNFSVIPFVNFNSLEFVGILKKR
jgi:rod shape-determining protein MreC